MTIINRSDVPLPVLPEEETYIAEFGGEVIVKALTLRERLAVGDVSGDGASRMLAMLHTCVVDVNREPIFTTEQWEVFAARHMDTIMRLWDIARALSGLDDKVEEGEKKEAPTPN
jgi:hypothetical protein